MDGEAYMCWNDNEKWRENQYLSKKDVKTCEENIKYITENATLMTKEEVEEFINYDYMEEIPQLYTKTCISRQKTERIS